MSIMKLKNSLKLFLLVITLWLVSVTFQQTFANLINNYDIERFHIYEEYKNESQIDIYNDINDVDEHESNIFLFTVPYGTKPEDLVDENNNVFIDEDGNVIVPLSNEISEDDVVIELPHEWDYDFDYDDSFIIIISPPKADAYFDTEDNYVDDEIDFENADVADLIDEDKIDAYEGSVINDSVISDSNDESINNQENMEKFVRGARNYAFDVANGEELRARIHGALPDVVTTITITQSFTLTNDTVINLPQNSRIILRSNQTGITGQRTISSHTSSNVRHFIVGNGAHLTLENNIILDGANANQGSVNRGGITVNGAGARLTLNEGSVIQNNRWSWGGGIRLEQGATFVMNGGEIRSNFGANGGGGVASDTTTAVIMNGGIIRNNDASTTGGGLHFNHTATFTMNGGVIRNNNSLGGNGGGVELRGDSKFTMEGGEISHNTSSGNAAGVLVNNNAIFTMLSGTISDNNAAGNGGGLDIRNGGTFTMHNGTITRNVGNIGGGLQASTNGTFYMNGGIITGNIARNAAGGVQIFNSIFTMNGGTITDNTAENDRGGVSVQDASIFTMNNGTISNNSARDGGGVGLMATDSETTPTFTMLNGIINGNRAIRNGGGIYATNQAIVNLNGGTISNNIATTNGGGIFTNPQHNVPSLPNPAFAGLSVASAVNFSGNRAGNGAFRPPSNLEYSGILTTSASVFTHPLNNFDINFTYAGLSARCDVDVYNETQLRHIIANAPIDCTPTKTIRLGANINLDQTGLIEIIEGRNITLMSTDATQRLLTRRQGTTRHFRITSGSLTINNITIQAGTTEAPETNRGGIEVDGSNAYLILNNNSVIRFNKTARGGGVLVRRGGDLTMNGGQIVNNVSETQAGGVAIDNSGTTFTMNDGTISHNNAKGIADESGWGGGIHISGGPIFIMNNGIISNNRASLGGGGLQVFNSSFIMNGGIISGNSAYGTEVKTDPSEGMISTLHGGGGGIRIQSDSTFTMNGGQISNNHAAGNGAGVKLTTHDSSLVPTFNMTGGTISKNETEGLNNSSGGGVYIDNGSTFDMTGGMISDNKAHGNNVGTISGGGGIAVRIGSIFIMRDGIVRDNTAVNGDGGGVLCIYNSECTLENGEIHGNHAIRTGGFSTLRSAEFTMLGGIIRDNHATLHAGGIEIWGDAVGFMSGGEIRDNTAQTNAGGVRIGYHAIFTMSGGEVRNNRAYGTGGGGIWINDRGTFNMSSGRIDGNRAVNGDGGGILIYSAANAILTGGNITNNDALHSGGGIFTQDRTFTNLTIEPLITFNGNIADGGATRPPATIPPSINNLTSSIFNHPLNNFDINMDSVVDFDIDNCTVKVADEAQLREAIGWQSGFNGCSTLNPDRPLNIQMIDDISMVGEMFVINGGRNIHLASNNNTMRTLTRSVGSMRHFNITDGMLTLQNHTTIDGDATNLAGTNTRGGIQVNGLNANLMMNAGSIITRNRQSPGGAVRVINGATFTMNGGEISHNSSNSNGGGVDVRDNATFVMLNGMISDNHATGNGGGLDIRTGAIFTMKNGTIARNEANLGAGLQASTNGTIHMYAGTISDNHATNGSGGVQVFDSTFIMNGGVITGNIAPSNSGGVRVQNFSTFTMNNGTISNNSARTGAGIGFTINDQTATPTFNMINGTISGNIATTNGGGIHAVSNAVVNLINGTISNNTARENGGAIFTQNPTFANLNIDPLIIFNGNRADGGAFRPPNNPTSIINNTSSSVFNHPLNNFDINFIDGSVVKSLIIVNVAQNRHVTVTSDLTTIEAPLITGNNPDDLGNIYVTFQSGTNPTDITVELPDHRWEYTMIVDDETYEVIVQITPQEISTINFEFVKTDESIYNLDLPIDEVNRIDGAIFTLERSINDEWKLISTETSGEKERGLVQFEELQYEGLYRLTEIQAPNGFHLPEGHWYIKVDENGEIAIQAHGTWLLAFRKYADVDDDKWFVGNMREIELPDSGGIGVIDFTLIGGVALGLATLIYIRQRFKDDLKEKMN